jgi:hypothetical protein
MLDAVGHSFGGNIRCVNALLDEGREPLGCCSPAGARNRAVDFPPGPPVSFPFRCRVWLPFALVAIKRPTSSGTIPSRK